MYKKKKMLDIKQLWAVFVLLIMQIACIIFDEFKYDDFKTVNKCKCTILK